MTFNYIFRACILLCFIILLPISFCSCGGDSESNDQDVTTTYQWTNISPYGGFVPSIAFNPDNNEIWLSGDDASGLYKKSDPSSPWVLIKSVPADWSTYSLTIDPNDSSVVYAPSHFGRGLIKTTDGGGSWVEIGTGLPTALNEKRIGNFAVYPADSNILFACTQGGLYRSFDSGLSFAKIASTEFLGYDDFTSIVISDESTPKVIIGNSKGGVYISTNGGESWTTLVAAAADGLPVSDIAVTRNALYVGYSLGYIGKTTNFSGPSGYGLINDVSGSADIESGYTTRIAAVSGDSAASDILYIGTVYRNNSTKWGFHVSADGGNSYTKRVDGLDNHSIFSLAVSPNDPDHVIVGTFNGGVYVSTDAGENWSNDSSAVYATASFGFAEDPIDADHIIFSSSAGLQGTSKVYETFSGGDSWSQVNALDDKNIMSLYIDSDASSILLAGTFHDGMYRSTSGSAGPWTQVITNTCSIREVERDLSNSSHLYAITDEMVAPNPDSAGLYFSDNKGGAWERRVTFALLDIKPHPVNGGEAVAVGPDAYATTDSFASVLNSLGLAAFAPGKLFTSIAFDPENPETVLVGTSTGQLYLTENYSSGGGCNWYEINNPSQQVLLLDIEIDNRNGSPGWYVLCWTGDTSVQVDSTPGIMFSADKGNTWAFINDGLYPSQLTWKMKMSHFNPTTRYVGLWGGGFMRLDTPF